MTQMQKKTYRFRPMIQEDMKCVSVLNSLIFKSEWKQKWLMSCLSLTGIDALVAIETKTGSIIGLVIAGLHIAHGYHNLMVRTGYINVIGVHPYHQGHGVGSSLLRQTISALITGKRATGILLHCQTTNKRAVSFYTDAGFRIIDTINDKPDDETEQCYLFCYNPNRPESFWKSEKGNKTKFGRMVYMGFPIEDEEPDPRVVELEREMSLIGIEDKK